MSSRSKKNTQETHFEDDLSYVYDLGGDSLTNITYADDEEEQCHGETKALLMKVMNENKMQNEKIKALEDAIMQIKSSKSNASQHTLNTREMESFLDDDDIPEFDGKRGMDKVKREFSKVTFSEGIVDNIYECDDAESFDNRDLHVSLSSIPRVSLMISARRVVIGVNSLSDDTYTLMMLSDGILHPDWILGFVVFFIQLVLGFLALQSQVKSEDSFFDIMNTIPINAERQVLILQAVAIFIAAYSQEDVFNAIALMIDLRLKGPYPWGGIPIADNLKQSKVAWTSRILIPNIVKCLQGFVVLLASFIILVRSTDAVELLLDFTALYVISSVDNIIFSIARRGFLGSYLLIKTARAEDIQVKFLENAQSQKQLGSCHGAHIKTIVLHTILMVALCLWIMLVVFQKQGYLAKVKYSECRENNPVEFDEKWRLLENNECNMIFNTPPCLYDGGDCFDFNAIYTGCIVHDVTKIGNGICDGLPYNSKLCRYDGGDCSIENFTKAKYPLCEKAAPLFKSNWTLIENDICDMVFNIPQCAFDGGDCANFNLFYPGCREVLRNATTHIDTSKVGDGICNGYPYNATECDYDGGDCL